MTKVLLLRFGALGDLLLSVPAVLALRSQVPGPHIALLGHEAGVAFLKSASIIEKGISQDDPRLLGLFRGNQAGFHPAPGLSEFDIVVGWLGDPASPIVGNLKSLGRKVVVAPSRPPDRTRMHVADFLLDTLAPLGIERTGETSPCLRFPGDAANAATISLPTLNPGGALMVAIHPGSGSPRKNWSASGFARTTDLLTDQGASVVLISGPADDLTVEAMLSETKSPVRRFHNLPLPQLSALLARCDVYLGNDSGITHLAALSGVPTVALFGPTDPTVWGPRGRDVRILPWEGEGRTLSPRQLAETILEVASGSPRDYGCSPETTDPQR